MLFALVLQSQVQGSRINIQFHWFSRPIKQLRMLIVLLNIYTILRQLSSRCKGYHVLERAPAWQRVMPFEMPSMEIPYSIAQYPTCDRDKSSLTFVLTGA